MNKGLFIAILSILTASAHGEDYWGQRCSDLLLHAEKYRGAQAKPMQFNPEFKYTWYMTVDFGNVDKAIYEDEGSDVREIDHLIPTQPGAQAWRRSNLFLDPKANPMRGFYTAEMTFNFNEDSKKSSSHFMLYEPLDERVLAKVRGHLELTWRTYLKAGTVTEKEIEDFKQIEAQLDPLRTITIVAENAQNETVSVVRLYDGSPYSMYYMGPRVIPRDGVKSAGNYQLSLERRYPDINFRSETEHIFEPGRQSIDGSEPNEFKRQLRAMAVYFYQKYGAQPDVIPGKFLKEGRIYVEITSRHLLTYLAKEKGGLGFTLHSMTNENGEMVKADETLEYKDLKVNRRDSSQKFILYRNLEDFTYGELSTAKN